MICENCGIEYDGRSNSMYCSNKCKQEAFKKRQLSDGGSSINPYTLKSSSSRSNDMKAMNTITTNVVGSLGGGLGNTLSDGISKITRINNNPYYTLSMIGGAFIGGYIGFNIEEKKKTLVNLLLGSGIGLLAGQLAYTLYHQFDELNKQRSIEEVNTVQPMLNDNSVVSSQEIKYMNIPSMRFDGIFGEFLGNSVNYNFTALVYGSPGGGKSHFATYLAKYIEQAGKVLYVLAEEQITPHVKERISKYSTQNTDYKVTRKESDVIALLKTGNYKFVVIDSINGMVNYNNHLSFVTKLKELGLYGIIILNQVNKNGQFTGKQEVLHEVDIEIIVEDGVAMTAKNRFNLNNKSLNIFPSNKVNAPVVNNYNAYNIGVN